MRIALLEDDADQARLIVHWLSEAGHNCTHFSGSRDFLRTTLRDSFDLLVLDWLVPDMTGLEVLKRLRQSAQSYTPVLFVTQKDREEDVVEALESGADDYMPKPVRQYELLARAKALGRRARGGRRVDEVPDVPPYDIDLKAKSISLNDEEVQLTHREFDLAYFLFNHAGRVVSRSHILESIWGMHGTELNTRTVDTHVSRLRKKLKFNAETGWKLSAIYQHGYRLEKVGEPTTASEKT